ATSGPMSPRRISCISSPLRLPPDRRHSSLWNDETGHRGHTVPGLVAATGSADPFGEVGQQGGLRLGADDRLDQLAALEDRHVRDRHDLVLLGGLRGLVAVHLRYGDRVLARRADLVEKCSNPAARWAPF